jgi:hypothetical protein
MLERRVKNSSIRKNRELVEVDRTRESTSARYLWSGWRTPLYGLLSRPRLSRSHRFPGTCRFERRREIEEYGVLSVSRRELDPQWESRSTPLRPDETETA